MTILDLFRVWTLAFVLAVFPAIASAQSPQIRQLLLRQNPATAAAPAFQGVGDVKTTGWVTYWGTSAFTAATRGTKLINACDSTGGADVACADMLSDVTTGSIVPQVIGGITCPSANCTIKTYYDLSAGARCGGPCDMTQATVAARAVLTANALGGASTKTCGVATSGVDYSNGSFTPSLSSPYSAIGIVKYGSATAGFYTGGGSSTGFGALSSTFAFYSPSTVTGAAWDTNPHVLQNISNSTSSFLVTDTSTGTTQNAGVNPISTTIGLFRDNFPSNRMPTGSVVCGTGINSTAFNGTDTTNLYNIQHIYWGF